MRQSWERVEAAFDALLDLSPPERAHWLASRLAELSADEQLQLQNLLRRADAPTSELLAPAAAAQLAEPALSRGDRVGVWEIDGELGQGGQGRVYRVQRQQGGFAQCGVLKLAHGVDAGGLRRFLRERRLLARLDHPAIPRLIDGGQLADGRPWWVGELVEGERVDAYVSRKQLDPAGIVRCCLPLLDAVAHAHARLILHRDLKPANVLVDRAGQPHLLDFGIGRALDADSVATSQSFSAAYAAPEQVRGDALGVAVDVHGLGALLYRLLAGVAPFEASDLAASVHAVLQREPVPIAGLDRELWAILARALRKEPEQRYVDVNALAQDLRAWLEGRPVQALAGGRRYVLRKFLRRHRWPLLAGSLALMAVLSSSFAALWQAHRSTAAQLAAEQAQAEAVEALAQSEWDLDSLNLTLAYQGAYSRALQQLFGPSSGLPEERLRAALLTQAEEAHAAREQDPEAAALVAFALGRHFVFQHDHATGVRILERWLDDGYGDVRVRTDGMGLLARAYPELGRRAEATELLRQIEANLAGSRDRLSMSHLAAASQLALASEQEADLRHAIEVINASLALPRHQAIASGWAYPYNQRALLQTRLGDFEAALTDLRKAQQLEDAGLSPDPTGARTGLLNLAMLELFHRRDVATVAQLLTRYAPAAELQRADRPSAHPLDGRALLYYGVLAQQRNEPAAAITSFQLALAALTDVHGSDHLHAMNAAAWLAEAQAAAGVPETAERILDDLRLREADPALASFRPRLRLAEAAVALHRGDHEQARTALSTTPELAARVRSSAELSYLLQRLQAQIQAHPDRPQPVSP